MQYFNSTIDSLDGNSYEIKLYSESYNGFNAQIIGGTGLYFYVKGDWTDYLELAQPLIIEGTTNESDNVQSFSYNAAQDRTEIQVYTETYVGTFIRIRNDNTEPASFVPIFSPKIISLETEWNNSNDYILSPLMTSETTLVYSNVQEVRTGVDTAFFDRFIESYMQSNDNELKVVITKNSELYWVGNLVVDLIEWDNENSPRTYTFKAIDGIARLKNVYYDGDIYTLNTYKIIDIIKNILSLNDLAQFWDNAAPYIIDSIEYKSTDVTSVSAAHSPLDYSYLAENLLLAKEQNTDNSPFMSGYDILYGICEIFSAKLVHSNGRYWILQTRNYDTTAFTIRTFNKLNNTYAATTYNHTQTGLRVMSGGKFSYLYGIKTASIEAESPDLIAVGGLGGRHVEIRVSNLGSAMFVDFNSNVYENPAQFGYNIGKISGGISSGNVICVALGSTTFGSAIGTFDMELRIYITEGNKYIKGGNGVQPYWGDDLVATDRYYSQKYYGLGTGGQTQRIKLITPVIPYEFQNALVDIECVITNAQYASLMTDGTWVGELWVDIYAPTEQSAQTELITVDNPSDNFTKDLKLENIIINEGNALITINTLNVNKTYVSGGAANIIPTKFWDGDFDLDGTLSVLRVLEAMSLQFRPLTRYWGSLAGDHLAINTWNYDGKKFAPTRIRKDYNLEQIDGDWHEVANSKVGLTSNINYYNELINEEETSQGTMIYVQNRDKIGTLIGDISIGLTSALSVNLDYDIKEGDTLQIIDANNFQVLQKVIVVNDLASGLDVSIDIEEIDNENVVSAGSFIVRSFRDLNQSGVYRFDTLQHTGVAVEPLAVEDMRENEVRVVLGDVFIRSGSEIYKIEGTLFI